MHRELCNQPQSADAARLGRHHRRRCGSAPRVARPHERCSSVTGGGRARQRRPSATAASAAAAEPGSLGGVHAAHPTRMPLACGCRSSDRVGAGATRRPTLRPKAAGVSRNCVPPALRVRLGAATRISPAAATATAQDQRAHTCAAAMPSRQAGRASTHRLSTGGQSRGATAGSPAAAPSCAGWRD